MSDTAPVSEFVQRMTDALDAIRSAQTPGDRRRAEEAMADLLRGSRRLPADYKLAQAGDTE